MLSKKMLGSFSILFSLGLFSADIALAADTRPVPQAVCGACVSDGFFASFQTCCTTIDGVQFCSERVCTPPPKKDDTLPLDPRPPKRDVLPFNPLSPGDKDVLKELSM